MQILQTIPANTVALEGAVYNGTSFFTDRGDGQPIHPFTTQRTKQGSVLWPQFAPPRANSTAVALNARRSIFSGDAELYMQCEVAGTTAASAPVINYNQIGQTVVDGTVTWRVKGLHAWKGFSNWPARTNLTTHSNGFDNAAWQKINGTIATGFSGPDGSATSAFKFVENTATAIHYLPSPEVIAFVSGTTYTLSVYVKASGRNYVQLYFSSSSFVASGRSAWFDLVNGTVGGAQGGVTANITKVGNGYYRCSITATANSSGTKGGGVTLSNTGGYDQSYLGDGTSGVLLYSAQIEAAGFASPPIATTTATVTRAATNLSLPTAGNIRENNFGVDMWVIPGEVGSLLGTSIVFLCTRVDANNFTQIYAQLGDRLQLQKMVGGVSEHVWISGVTYSPGTPVRIQVFFSASGIMGCRLRQYNGVFTSWTTLATASGSFPVHTTLSLGNNGANSAHFPGNYPATRFILHADPKAELERLAAIDDLWVAGGI